MNITQLSDIFKDICKKYGYDISGINKIEQGFVTDILVETRGVNDIWNNSQKLKNEFQKKTGKTIGIV